MAETLTNHRKAFSLTLCLCLCQTLSTFIWPQSAAAQRTGPPMVKIEDSGDAPTTKILFIGQSILFAYNLPHVFHALAKSKRPQDVFLIEMVAGGGYSLKDHYQDGTALRELKKERWNYVIIQESTANQIVNHQPYELYAPFFDQEARKVGAKPLQFECYDDSLEENCPMHLEVLKVAAMVHEPVIPVGTAWRYVTKYYPRYHIFGYDHHHPSALGTYLMACVLYSKIYKEPTEGAQVDLEFKNATTSRIEVLNSVTDPALKTLEQASWTVVKALP